MKTSVAGTIALAKDRPPLNARPRHRQRLGACEKTQLVSLGLVQVQVSSPQFVRHRFGYIFLSIFSAKKSCKIFWDTGIWVLYTPSACGAPQFGFAVQQPDKESLFLGCSKTSAMPC
jgi:hypothetical protein